ncbi:MAG: dTDP-4-dehydrorhamnose 3,5-epimerase family protein [Microgenomates group bacterium]
MKILEIKSLVFPEIKVIRFARFTDERGYFSETYRFGQLEEAIPDLKIKQVMESHSKKRVLRGFHLQYNPAMGKLVRTVVGEMIDFFLDLRVNSKTFGFIGGYRMPSKWSDNYDEWIWIPPGFAHGNLYLKESTIEYFATATYNPQGEVGIYPLADDINWSYCDKKIKKIFDQYKDKLIISEKDKKGLTVAAWKKDQRSKNSS